MTKVAASMSRPVTSPTEAAALSDGHIKPVPSTGGAVYGWASSVDNVSTDQTFFRPFNLETDF